MTRTTACLALSALIAGCAGATPPADVSNAAAPTASAAPATGVSPSPRVAGTFSLEYVRATPLGALTGDVAWLIREGQENGLPVREIVVVDLASGQSRVALHYRRRAAEPADAEAGPVALARQLAPDNRRVVLDDVYLPIQPGAAKVSDPGQPLLIADLVSGALTVLSIPGVATDAVDPAWAPHGDTIAFARRPLGAPRFGDDGVWIVDTDGSGLRRLTDGDQGGYSYVFGWTADGSGVAFGVGGIGLIRLDYRIVDISSRAVKKLDGYVESIAPGSWRSGTPAFAGAFTDDPGSRIHAGAATRVVVADAGGGNARTVFTEPVDQNGRPRLINVRWNPSADKLLAFVVDPGQNGARIIDLASGRVTSAGRGRAGRIEWAPNGIDLVCLVSSPPTAPVSVTISSGDAACGRELLPGSFDWSVLDLATARYP